MGLDEKEAYEQRFEEGEGVNQANILERAFQEKEKGIESSTGAGLAWPDLETKQRGGL